MNYNETHDQDNFGDGYVKINRPVYTCDTFNEKYEHITQPPFSLVRWTRQCASRYCSHRCFKNALLRFFPFISILRNYNWKRNFYRDLIAGLTVSAMHIPQGMAYGQLATLRPVHGLYVSFFPVLLYFFFGTSRHLSIGSFAVISLMVAKVVDAEIAKGLFAQVSNQTHLNTTFGNDSLSIVNTTTAAPGHHSVMDPLELALRVDLAVSLNLITGIFQILLGIVGAGFVTEYLSDPFISGYTTGCACHVFTSQLKYIFGVKIQRHTAVFKIYYTWRDVIMNIMQTNLVTFGLSASAAIFLIVCKFVIDPRLQKVSPMPLPAELILMVLADTISYFANLGPSHRVQVVGPIPKNLPMPRIPSYFQSQLIFDSIPLVLVSFSLCISMGKLFGKKYKYRIRPNQEFFAVGISNAVSSFFDCYTASASMSRSLVQANVGGETQLASVISCLVILAVLLFLGSLLQPLPTCILAIVVMINLRGMFMQAKDLKKYWKHCKLDVATWLVAFFATVLIDVDIGLYIGVAFVLLTVIYQSAKINAGILRRAGNTEIFANSKCFSNLCSTHPAIVLKWTAPIYFATVDKFVLWVVKSSSISFNKQSSASESPDALSDKPTGELEPVNPVFGADEEPLEALVINTTLDFKDDTAVLPSPGALSTTAILPRRALHIPAQNYSSIKSPSQHEISAVILDLSGVAFIDTVGLEGIIQIATDLASSGLNLLLTACPEHVLRMLATEEILFEFNRSNVFVSTADALAAIRRGDSFTRFKPKGEAEKLLAGSSRSSAHPRQNILGSQASLLQSQLDEDEIFEQH